jgi:hypothetical protein
MQRVKRETTTFIADERKSMKERAKEEGEGISLSHND